MILGVFYGVRDDGSDGGGEDGEQLRGEPAVGDDNNELFDVGGELRVRGEPGGVIFTCSQVMVDLMKLELDRIFCVKIQSCLDCDLKFWLSSD